MNNENKPKNGATRATIGGKVDKGNINLLDKLFEIPLYQRLYEWKKEQIETLLDDMKKAFDESKENYFIGNITTSKKGDKFMLIDGQQRLTTLWFVGFYLASKDSKSWQNFIVQGDDLRISMPIRDDEENALTELAKNINGKENLAQSLQGYGVYKNIIDAFKCIESWFVNSNGKNIDLANFAKYIYENVCFVFVILAENTDLNRFFVRMNNRGKQLEKHEILKARLLNAIRESYKNEPNKKDEWQKYAKIWDLCSDMDKYIFQSASDRSILKSKSQNENSAESSNNNDSLVKIADIVEKYKIPETNKSKEKDSPSKVESIIDFPTFLLHCYKLWIAKKCKYKIDKITISKDRLLEIMWDNKVKNEEIICCKDFIFNDKDSGNAKQDCKEFIIDMLRYRVLFDYFVIKDNKKLIEKGKNSYAIKHLDKDNNGYYSVADNNALEKLAMVQNYLRVARQGEKQNYHHWLTPFLKFLYKHIRLDMNLTLDETKEFNFENFKYNAEKIANQFSNINKCERREKVIVRFLENLDTKLAIAQLNKTSENDLLGITNETLLSINKHLYFPKEQASRWQKYKNIYFSKKCFLNQGTKTPHYWFYRLEYYLWKWGTLDETEFKTRFGDNFDNLKLIFSAKLGEYDFKSIAKSFYFRNLNSIEHFHPQHLKKQNGWETYIDYFGNLALISNSTNSQYSDQLPKEKKEDLKNKLNKKGGNIESLKFFLMCAQCEQDKNKWVYDNNVKDKHEKQMIDILIKSLNSQKQINDKILF